MLTGAGVLFGVWRMHAQTDTRIDSLARETNNSIDSLARDMTRDTAALRERMAHVEGKVDSLAGVASALRNVIVKPSGETTPS